MKTATKKELLIINSEFSKLIPPLSAEELQGLEQDIITNGCRIPIDVWDNQIVDGHNRYNICTQHDIPFKTNNVNFDDIDSAKIWIINNQLNRRNLALFTRGELELKRDEIIEKQEQAHKNKQAAMQKARENNPNNKNEQFSTILEKTVKNSSISTILEKPQTPLDIAKNDTKQDDLIKVDTTQELANKINTGYGTASKIKVIHEKGSEHEKEKLRKGETTINKVYKDIKKEEKREKRKQDLEQKALLNTIPVNITLLEGDVFDKINDVKDNSVDLLIIDPPYFMNKAEWDSFESEKDFFEFTDKWIKAIIPKLSKLFIGFICFNPEYSSEFEQILKNNDLPIQSRLVWHYRNAGGKSAGKYKFSRTYEIIYHLGNKELNFSDDWNDERFDVWTIAVPQDNFNEGKYHPTQKPLELFKKLIVLGSNDKDSVLDCFAGSGTTGLLCKELDRNCILIEKEEEYIKTIKGRLNG